MRVDDQPRWLFFPSFIRKTRLVGSPLDNAPKLGTFEANFRGYEAKKSTRAMARWHWLERRPWLIMMIKWRVPMYYINIIPTCWKYSCINRSTQSSETSVGLNSLDTSQALIKINFNEVKSFEELESNFMERSLNSCKISACLAISVAKMSKLKSWK